MVQINWTFQAKDDLQNIAEYISKDSEKYARLQILRIRQRSKFSFPKLMLEKWFPRLKTKMCGNLFKVIIG